MNPITQRIILSCLAIIEYVMSWNVAPVSPEIKAEVDALAAQLGSSTDELDKDRADALRS